MGIISCNGADQRTLLKILSRITKPTTGRVLVGADGFLVTTEEIGGFTSGATISFSRNLPNGLRPTRFAP